MKKKLLSLVMVLAMALSLLPTAAFAVDPTYTFTPGDITVSAAEGSSVNHATLTISGNITVKQKDNDTGTALENAPTSADSLDVKLSITGPEGFTAVTNETVTVTGNSFSVEKDLTVAGTYNVTVTYTAKASLSGYSAEVANDAGTKTGSATATLKADEGSGGSPTAITSVEVTATPSSVTQGTATDVTLAVSKVNNNADLSSKVQIDSVSWAKSQNGNGDPTKISPKSGSKTVYTFAADTPADTYTGTVTLALAANVSDYTLDTNTVKPTVQVTVSASQSQTGFGTPTYSNGTLSWTYADNSADASAFSIKVDNQASTATISKGSSGYSVSIAQTSNAQAVVITYTPSGGGDAVTKNFEIPASGSSSLNTEFSVLTASYDAGTLNLTFNVVAKATTAAAGQSARAESDLTTVCVDIHSGDGEPTEANRVRTYDDVSVTKSGDTYSVQIAVSPALSAGTYSAWVMHTRLNSDIWPGGKAFTVASATTPTTPTETIPSAGSVTNSAAAESAIKNIQNSDTDKIAEDVGKELTDTSSSASTETIDKLEALDQAVQDKAGITVAVAPDSKAPDAINTKKVSIVGAALNAEKTSNTKIELQISAPKTERTLGRTYDNDAAVQFSMTLTNVVSTKKLAVPVIISLPLPSGISSSRAVVLHYAGTDSASQVLPSKVSGGYISFVVTGFSDFIITQRAEKKTSTSGGGGGGYSKVTNIPVTVTPNTPSTPAGIFTDVPANHSFASQITWARDNGVMGGYSDGSFRPTNPTNRQQLWMVLARLSGASPADMAAAREWAVNAGVSDGTNGEGTLSRQQLVTMLYRYAQSQEMNLEGAADLSTYPDNASVASYAGEALAWAVGKGIVTGTSDGRLNPEGTATRGQFAVMMYRFSHQS